MWSIQSKGLISCLCLDQGHCNRTSHTCGLLVFHCSEVAYFSAASESRLLAAALSVAFSTLDMSLSATPQLYSAE